MNEVNICRHNLLWIFLFLVINLYRTMYHFLGRNPSILPNIPSMACFFRIFLSGDLQAFRFHIHTNFYWIRLLAVVYLVWIFGRMGFCFSVLVPTVRLIIPGGFSNWLVRRTCKPNCLFYLSFWKNLPAGWQIWDFLPQVKNNFYAKW